VRRSGRIMNRKDRDRGVEMRLTERTGKLIPETDRITGRASIGASRGKKTSRVNNGTLSRAFW